MSFLKRYKAKKAAEGEEYKRWAAERQLVEDGQKKEILAVLARVGVPPSGVRTNGYWFEFSYKGMRVNFVNQENRLCGEVYRAPLNREEEEVLRDAHRITMREDDLADEFRREFLYKDFVIYDEPSRAVYSVLGVVKDLLEKTAPSKG